MADNASNVDRGGTAATGDNNSGSGGNTQGQGAGNTGGRGSRRSRANRHHNNNNNHGPKSPKFVPSCQELKDSYFDVGDSGGIFTRVTRDVGEYIATNFENAGAYRNGLAEMSLPAPVEPTRPTPDAAGNFDPFDFEEQCSDNLRAMFEADNRWSTGADAVNLNNDVIGLLVLIQHYMNKRQTHKDPMLSVVDQERKLMNYKQGEKVSNLKYLQEFKNLVEGVKQSGSWIG